MSKTEFTASANVRITIEVQNLGPYGADWTAEKIHEQTSREAIVWEHVRKCLEERRAS